MAGGLFVLPKMHKITQNSLLKKHGIFCLTFSPGTFPVETIAFDYDVLKRTNGLHLDDLSKRIAEQNHQLVNAYQEMYRPLLQLKGSIFSKIYSETGESADNILGFERKNQ